jgi:RNA polymerase sigma factor (sigma-70 family)
MNKKTRFNSKYKEVLNEKLIRNFLKENNHLLENYLKAPSKENQQELDNAFKIFYKRVRTIKYISKMIHFYSIDYDKRQRKIQSRYELTFDNPEDGERKVLKSSEEPVLKNEVTGTYELRDVIQDNKLYEKIINLSEKQYQVLNLIYYHGFSSTEVAEIMNTSIQSISYNHKKALDLLK